MAGKTDEFAGVKMPRSPVYGTRGMVVSGHSQASIAVLRMLERGGNVVDAILIILIKYPTNPAEHSIVRTSFVSNRRDPPLWHDRRGIRILYLPALSG